MTATAGVATFSSLSINQGGTGYTLRATSGAFTAITSGAFAISSRLAITTSAQTITAGATTGLITVTVQDPNGTLVKLSSTLTLYLRSSSTAGTFKR